MPKFNGKSVTVVRFLTADDKEYAGEFVPKVIVKYADGRTQIVEQRLVEP